MDADRFDTWAKQLSAPTSRRAALRTSVAGGVLGVLGLSRAVPEAAAQGGTCVVAFTAQVRQGPSLQQALLPGGRAGEVRGDLRFALSAQGALQHATLTLADGTSLPVVGDAAGHSLQLRIALGPQQALVAVGVGEQEIVRCQGAIDGVVAGPQSGDLGDWHAAGQQAAGGGEKGSGKKDRANAAAGGATAAVSNPGRAPRGGTQGAGGQSGVQGGSGNQGGSGGNQGGRGTQGANTPSCAAGLTVCGDACVNLQTDPLNCGACGDRCAVNTCTGGVCGEAGASLQNCAPPFAVCGGACVDLSSDPLNCSACGIACGTDEVCSDSLCVPAGGGGGCVTGLTRCGTSCADILIDPKNCGACGVVCEGVDECLDGFCTTPVGPAPQTCVQLGEVCDANPCCLGECVTRQDASSICMCSADGEECIHQGSGGCCSGQPCNADGFCGVCGTPGTPCNSDAECCSGSQYAALCCFDGVSLTTRCTDVTNIGFVCPGDLQGPVTCDAGLTDCGGACVDLASDAANCGGCGFACAADETCQGGACVATAPVCPFGQADCGAGCIDVFANPANCGVCGTACAADETCFGGVCTGGLEIPGV